MRATVETLRAMAEAIQSLGQVPKGHLYASVMHVLDLASFNRSIEALKAAGVVTEQNLMLTWLPAKDKHTHAVNVDKGT